MDRKVFFDRVRAPLFGGSLDIAQVEHVEAILDASAATGWPIAYAAYALATAHHETARFRHLLELGGETYFRNLYDPLGNRPALAKANGNTKPGDGARYRGRGYVHLTWRDNYERAGAKIGLNLVDHPELAAEPMVAARVMIAGMEEGWFTGKKLVDYLAGARPDYLNARRIINGMDKAEMIAGYARAYEKALQYAGYGKVAPPAADKPRPVPPPPERPREPGPAILTEAPKPGLWARFVAAFRRRLKG